ncbi:hypothetical protein [Oceanicoccus sagamiensis]|uniref:ATP-grasp domain-containing protein n=1 Tax=Oceanicoccus sagamiensis TaxID=716816 RepID=A0A1X9N9X3_9GAMM|nr:hypothetical protein [Oceanicoccus sagamiensis]ARN73222.1 hypothetical protein BST96_03335 [Oceanicoccus sagamiensis]
MYNNGLFAANRLANDYQQVQKVILLSEFVRASMWASERLQIIQEAQNIASIVELVKAENIDFVVNLNSIYGSAGIVETLTAMDIPCIGSNRTFSATEIDKRDFRHWLIGKGFTSPLILHEGMFDEIEAQMDQFDYPLVIKPDSQIGPKVSPCHNKEELKNYLAESAQRFPYARNVVLFSIEEYIPLMDELYVTYFMCGGKAIIWESNRLPHSWKATRDAGECAYGLIPNPNFEPYREQITQYLESAAEFTDNCIGIIQCGIAEDYSLFFVESNARPPTACLGLFDDPLAVLEALRDQDYDRLQALLAGVESHGAAIALMHKADTIEVDVDTLNQLEGFSYWPNSVEKEQGKYISHRRGAPSFLHVHGNTIDEVVARLQQHLPTIEKTGDYLTIVPESIKALYLAQGGASKV